MELGSKRFIFAICAAVWSKRPDDLASAWAVLRKRKNLRKGATAALRKVDEAVRNKLRAIVGDAG